MPLRSPHTFLARTHLLFARLRREQRRHAAHEMIQVDRHVTLLALSNVAQPTLINPYQGLRREPWRLEKMSAMRG